jgi:hypothetical protein
MLLFYQVATRLSLTTCSQIVELQDDNKLLEQLVTSLLSSTTLYQVVKSTHPVDKLLATSLQQVCYVRTLVWYEHGSNKKPLLDL